MPQGNSLLQLLSNDSSWPAQSVCSQTDPELFFPEKGGSVRAAKQTCAGCPVVSQCLEQALANDETYGIWGGMTPSQRSQIKKVRAQAEQLQQDRVSAEDEQESAA